MIATQKELQLSKVQDSNSGCECFFIKYEDVGIKLYYDEEFARRIAGRQQKASEHNLGPNVLSGVIEYHISEDLLDLIPFGMRQPVLYGYETEIVEVRKDTKKEDIKKFRQRFVEMLGCELYDCGCYNVGWKNGELVCVDFGDGSFDDNF